VDGVSRVLPCARLTTQPPFLTARVRSRGTRENGKPSLPGGKRATLTDSPPENSVRVRSEDGLAVVTPLAQLDAGNAQQFWAALASVTRDHSVIVADLSAQQDCDWHAMGALMMALRYTDAAGGELRVAAGRPAVRQVLTESGLDRLVAVFGTLAEAMPVSHPPVEPGLPGVESA
jgi:anti-anti-sigma regulatory factor